MAAGSTLLHVPNHVLLNADNVIAWCAGSSKMEQLIGEAATENQVCVLFLTLLVLMDWPPEDACTATDTQIHARKLWREWALLVFPEEVGLPTEWTEEERAWLRPTSLWTPTRQKTQTLRNEFDRFGLAFENLRSDFGEVGIEFMIRSDALSRSRSMEVPGIGTCIVPCVDLCNHADSENANAYYEVTADGAIELKLREGICLAAGEEITIDYGSDKSNAEFLFSYGFLSSSGKPVKKIALLLLPSEGDDLAGAKQAWAGNALLKIEQTTNESKLDSFIFESKALYAYALTDDDGFEFEVSHGEEGPIVRLIFGEKEIESPEELEHVVKTMTIWPVIRLRALHLIEQCIIAQTEVISALQPANCCSPTDESQTLPRASSRLEQSQKLCASEFELLVAAKENIAAESEQLWQNNTVLGYMAQ